MIPPFLPTYHSNFPHACSRPKAHEVSQAPRTANIFNSILALHYVFHSFALPGLIYYYKYFLHFLTLSSLRKYLHFLFFLLPAFLLSVFLPLIPLFLPFLSPFLLSNHHHHLSLPSPSYVFVSSSSRSCWPKRPNA